MIEILVRERRKLEFALYLKNHKLKVVDKGFQIAEKEEIVVSRLEYNQLLDSQLTISNELQSLRAENMAIKNSIKELERETRSTENEEELGKEEALKMFEDLESKILQLYMNFSFFLI